LGILYAQARKVSRRIRQLAKATCVAMCSGNHDNAGHQILQTGRPYRSGLLR